MRSNRLISKGSRTNDLTTRLDESVSCSTEVMSAVACWIRCPVLRIFLPKKSMKKSTTGNVQKAKRVSFQSR